MAKEITIRPTIEINMALLKNSKTPLPQLMLAVRDGLSIAAMDGDLNFAVCICQRRGDSFEIVHLAVLPEYREQGHGRELLLHTMDYIRFLGGDTVEMGAGNANVQLFLFLQRAGFRVTGVVPDFYIYGNERPEVENAIVNRDQIRYTADLEALVSSR